MADTTSNTRATTPTGIPKVDTLDTSTIGAAVTRVNTQDTAGEKNKRKSSDNVVVSEKPAADVANGAGDDSQYLTGRKLVLAHLGFLLAVFCFALDQTIVATALPKLASQFNALDELTWVVSAYFPNSFALFPFSAVAAPAVTQAGLMLTFGQILTIAPSKWVYMTTIGLFEIGSLICAVANSMNVLIFGRAFQGIGASG
ncbi:hypothetical protein FRC20_008843, partial [Serendipita sp. 405]